MKKWGSAKISTKLTISYSAVFFAVLVLLTLSTYFGVDYFLTKQAKDAVTSSSNGLSQNIYSAVDAAKKAAEKAAADAKAKAEAEKKAEEEKEAQEKASQAEESDNESESGKSESGSGAESGSQTDPKSVSSLQKFSIINTTTIGTRISTSLLTPISKTFPQIHSLSFSSLSTNSPSPLSSLSLSTNSPSPSPSLSPIELSEDEEKIIETVTVDENIWKVDNNPLGTGITASFYDNAGNLLSTNQTAETVKIPFTTSLGRVFVHAVDDNNRIVLNSVLTINNQPYYLQVVKEMAEESNFLHLLLGALIIVIFIGLMLAFLTGLFISRRMLKPIDAITKATRQIGMKDLAKRIETKGPDDELGRLTVTINEMLERLEKSFAMQTRFVSDASHELRTPVQVIQGYSGMLERWGKDDQGVLEESISAIRNEAENMKTLIENLLFLARGDSSNIKLSKEQFNLTDLIKETVKETRMINNSNITIQSNIENKDYYRNTNVFPDEASEQILVFADKKMIKEMLRAVIDNSLKYTPVNGFIDIDLTKKENFAVIQIADSGIGISEEKLPFVFDRFYRADAARSKDSTTKESTGAGLGLSIVKWIVDSHDGQIRVESGIGQGTKVTIEIPIK